MSGRGEIQKGSDKVFSLKTICSGTLWILLPVFETGLEFSLSQTDKYSLYLEISSIYLIWTQGQGFWTAILAFAAPVYGME